MATTILPRPQQYDVSRVPCRARFSVSLPWIVIQPVGGLQSCREHTNPEMPLLPSRHLVRADRSQLPVVMHAGAGRQSRTSRRSLHDLLRNGRLSLVLFDTVSICLATHQGGGGGDFAPASGPSDERRLLYDHPD